MRRLLAKKEELDIIYLDGNIDVMGVSETWLHELYRIQSGFKCSV